MNIVRNYSNYFAGPHIPFSCALFISGLAGLKVSISSPVQWVLSLVLLLGYAFLPQVRVAPATICSRLFEPPQRTQLFLFLSPWLLLCLGVGFSAILNGWQGVQTLPKFAALSAVLVLLILVRPTEPLVVRALQWLAVISLSALLFLWSMGVQGWLDFAPSRFGWVWAPPGVFWKAGIYLLPLVCWWVINARYSFAARWGWLLVCGVIVGLDGSRTASLLSLIIWVVVVGLGLARYGFERLIIKRGVMLAVIMMVTIGGMKPSSINPMSHIYAELGLWGDESLMGREIGDDSIRYAMVVEGAKGVIDYFPMGRGLGATTKQTESMPYPMVVHMTYLQLLADVGVLGLVGYLGIFLVPLFYGARRIRQAAAPWSCFDGMALPLGILGIYLFAGLLHPVSTEISEWLIVLVGLSMLAPDDLALTSGERR